MTHDGGCRYNAPIATGVMNMSETTAARWQLYIVRTAAGLLYTGISNNVPRRFQQHQKGTGAKALRGKGPLELLLTCEAGDRAMASRPSIRLNSCHGRKSSGWSPASPSRCWRGLARETVKVR